MEIFRKAPGQLIFEGQNLTRAMVLGSARKYVVEQQKVHELDADDLLVDMPNRVTRAWWHDAAGLVQEDYKGAVPVTVVNTSNDERVYGPRIPAMRIRKSGAPSEIL